MTMAARSKIQSRRKGQSMLEFAILLPILVLLFQILIETESAVSSAIVNQKYARSTLNYLMFNHRQYMEFKFSRNRENGNYHRRYWVGVDDKINFNGPEDGSIKPLAPLRKIGRNPAPQEDESAQSEYPDIQERQNVRIRVTSFTCLPPISVNPNGLLAEGNMRENTFLGTTYEFCSPQY